MILIVGTLLGLISVVFGAYAEHGLRHSVSDEHFRFLMTALRYNQMHAVMISAIGLVLLNGGKFSGIALLKYSAILFILGTVLFSFSIYISVGCAIEHFVKIAPVGGVLLMAAWLTLLVSAIVGRKK